MQNIDLEKLLNQQEKPEFRAFFSTRVLAKLERYQNTPVLGALILNTLYFRKYIYAASFCLLILLGVSFYQEGSMTLDHLLGLGGYTDEEILNFVNPLI
ncbi:MAG: hypothetical protein ACKVQB_04225 [Bacteroidia bacterium]